MYDDTILWYIGKYAQSAQIANSCFFDLSNKQIQSIFVNWQTCNYMLFVKVKINAKWSDQTSFTSLQKVKIPIFNFVFKFNCKLVNLVFEKMIGDHFLISKTNDISIMNLFVKQFEAVFQTVHFTCFSNICIFHYFLFDKQQYLLFEPCLRIELIAHTFLYIFKCGQFFLSPESIEQTQQPHT